MTATSNNLALIPDPTVTYTSPNATGSLAFTPGAGQSGRATITVTVRRRRHGQRGREHRHPHLHGERGAVNDPPILDLIADRTVIEDAGPQTVTLTGISAGPNETQVLTVTATSNNLALIPDPTVTYTSPNATGSLAFTPVANASGAATITVTVQDDGGTANGGVDTSCGRSR